MADLRTTYKDPVLTRLAIELQITGFIAPALFPRINANKSGEYYEFDNKFRKAAPTDDRLGERGQSKEVEYEMDRKTYDTEGHGLKYFISDEILNAADAVVRPRMRWTRALMTQLMVVREIAAQAAVEAAATGSHTSSPGNKWDDATNGEPIKDIDDAITVIENDAGFTPNVLALGSDVWRAMRRHPDFLDAIKYTGTNEVPANLARQGLMALFDLDDVVVANSRKNTAVEGQTKSLSRIWGEDVILAYVDASTDAAEDIPSFGYTFHWADAPESVDGWVVERYRKPGERGEYVDVHHYRDQKVVLADAVYRYSNVLT